MVGAVRVAAGYGPCQDRGLSIECQQAMGYLGSAVGYTGPEFESVIADYNDTHSHGDALDTVEQAIRLAKDSDR
jgi:hypothetical protein